MKAHETLRLDLFEQRDALALVIRESDDAILVEEFDMAEAVAFQARTHRVVEREQARGSIVWHCQHGADHLRNRQRIFRMTRAIRRAHRHARRDAQSF